MKFSAILATIAVVASAGRAPHRRQMQDLSSYTGTLGSSISLPSTYPITADYTLPSAATVLDDGAAFAAQRTTVVAAPTYTTPTYTTLDPIVYPELTSTVYNVDYLATAMPIEIEAAELELEYASGNPMYTSADNTRWEALRDSYTVEPSAPGNMHAVITKHLLDVGTWFGWFVQGTYMDSAQGFLGVSPPTGYLFDGTPVNPIAPVPPPINLPSNDTLPVPQPSSFGPGPFGPIGPPPVFGR
jgi:hypothetical protein